MRTFFSKRWLAALGVTACVLVILACQLPWLTTQTVGVPTSEVAAGSSPDATPVDIVFGPGSFRLIDPAVGLTNLSSYKATLTISFSGTQAGQPSLWSHTYVMLASQDNTAHQITVESAGVSTPPYFKAEMNGVSYELDGEKSCTGSTTGVGNSLLAEWEPAGFLSGLIGGEAAGSETVNGMASDKYTFDERALGETGFSQSTGQVWVASEKGFVVRYLLTTTAGADYFGQGIEGAQTWEYDLTDVNQPVTIDLPAGCPGGLVDAPLMPSPQNVRPLPGVTIYTTAGSIQDVFAFYQTQLPSLGWGSMGDPVADEAMGTAVFEKGDQQLVVIVTPAENGVEVRLLIGPAPSQ